MLASFGDGCDCQSLGASCSDGKHATIYVKHFRASKCNFSVHLTKHVLHREGMPASFHVQTRLLHAKQLDRQCEAWKMFSRRRCLQKLSTTLPFPITPSLSTHVNLYKQWRNRKWQCLDDSRNSQVQKQQIISTAGELRKNYVNQPFQRFYWMSKFQATCKAVSLALLARTYLDKLCSLAT